MCLCVCVYALHSWPYRQVLFLTCLSFFLIEAFPELTDAFVHQSHFHVALVQQLLLLLQLSVLLLVQLVTDLIYNTTTSPLTTTILKPITQCPTHITFIITEQVKITSVTTTTATA